MDAVRQRNQSLNHQTHLLTVRGDMALMHTFQAFAQDLNRFLSAQSSPHPPARNVSPGPIHILTSPEA